MMSHVRFDNEFRTCNARPTLPRLIVFREWLMKSKRSVLLLASLLLLTALLWPCSTAAQQPSGQATEGINSGNYNIRQTIEFGYRFVRDEDFTDPSGSRAVYNTFVNLGRGFRLFEHTLDMRSLNHQGWLFDNLSLSSFGYGGDPNDVTRLRAYKNKWYNFSATFRRDRNLWDYALLANPLNPNVTIANAPSGFSPIVTTSPHAFETSRRMGDYNLTLLPQSRFRLRLGYAHNLNTGPSFSSFHEGTDVLLFQNWKTTTDTYQVGLDFKYLPKTNISYDKFFSYYKGDTSWVDNNQTFVLSNLTPVDLGLPFNTAAGQPCAAPFQAAPPGSVNPACNGYLVYNRFGRVRTSYPTDQLSFQSNYFKNLDLSGRFMYSTSGGFRRGDVLNYNEFYQGLVTRTRERQFQTTGPAKYRRLSVSADFGATFYVTEKLRVIDMFRFANYRIPGLMNTTETSLFGTSMLVAPNIFTPGAAPPASCPTPTSAGCPQHNSSSQADIFSVVRNRFEKQDLKNNLFQVDYDFSKRVGARVGYRFRHRAIVEEHDAGLGTFLFFPTLPNGRSVPAPFSDELRLLTGATTCPAANNLPDGSCRVSVTVPSDPQSFEINEHSGLFGVWARPMDTLRVSFDVEILTADNSFTRISPRQLQHYKARATYKPVGWASFGAAVNITENRNNVFQTNNKQHNRSYGFDLALEPNEKLSLDFGYDYNDIFSTTFICYPISPAPPGLPACVAGPNLFGDTSFYKNKSNYGYVNLMWKPAPRLTTHLGYSLTSTSGSTLIITPNAPAGPLAFNYHRPYAGLAVDLGKGVAWKADWAYYGYNEKTLAGFGLLPRDFRGNMITIAFRYAF